MDDLVKMSLPNSDFWRGKRVFVTGHTGFKGGWLSLLLHRLGAEICGYALPPPTPENFFDICDVSSVLQHHLDDIRDAPALLARLRAFRPQVVFHLAAQPLVRASYVAPAATYATNVMGTVNILDAVRQTPGIDAAVIVTSDKVYAESSDLAGHAETDALGGRDPYSASKAAAELCAAAFPLPETAVATVRSGNVIGGGDFAADRITADFFRALQAGTRLQIRNPNAIRPWQHVLGPLCGYLRAAEFLATVPISPCRSWNFGPARAAEISVAALVEKLGRLTPKHEGFEITTAPDAPHEAAVLRLNSAKAKAELGWRTAWDLDTALARTASWYRAHAAGAAMPAFSRAQVDDYMQAGK